MAEDRVIEPTPSLETDVVNPASPLKAARYLKPGMIRYGQAPPGTFEATLAAALEVGIEYEVFIFR